MDQNDNDVFIMRKALARLDQLHVWPYPSHYLFIIGIGFFFGFYDILTIGFALPKIQQAFHIDLRLASWTVTSSLIGYIIGAFFISRVADNAGRRLGLILSISFFTLGSLGCAFSFSLWSLIIWRFITGIGIGAEIALVTTYMEELAPAPVRGQATCKAIAFGMLGFAIVPFIAYLLVPNFNFGWRILFLSGGVAGLFIYFTRRLLPDSPRWMLIHKHVAGVQALVNGALQYAKDKYGVVVSDDVEVYKQPLNVDTSVRSLFKADVFRKVLLFILLWFFYYIGNYAWLTLAPSLFLRAGFNLSQSIGFVALASFGFIVGSWLAIWMSDKFERKWTAMVIAFIWSVALLTIGFFPHPIVIVVAGFICTTTIAAIIPILYIYTGENFPTRIRATSLAITDGVGHLGGAFCAQIISIVSYFFSTMSYNYFISFVVMSVTGVITIILLLFGKKMTKHSLWEIELQDKRV